MAENKEGRILFLEDALAKRDTEVEALKRQIADLQAQVMGIHAIEKCVDMLCQTPVPVDPRARADIEQAITAMRKICDTRRRIYLVKE